MPRRTSIPRYTLHKATGQARARHNGRDIYFGTYDTPESHERYARFVAELAAQCFQEAPMPVAGVGDPDLTVSEVILAYLRHAKNYYGADSTEPTSLCAALKPVNELYGSSRVREFGPRSLKVVRDYMIKEQALSRNEINRRIGRIKRAFKWAVSEELVPPSVFHGLQSVTGLRSGRSAAKELPPVRPVAKETVELTLPMLAPPVAAICQLQMLTGMRPSEVCTMRRGDIDCSGKMWVYTPQDHKTKHLGLNREVPLGPQAQNILKPFMDRPSDAYLFRPEEAERWRNENRALRRNPNRKTKIFPCELRAREERKRKAKRTTTRAFRPCYTAETYRKAITYGIQKAQKAGLSIPHWFPYQTRHTYGTEVRKKFGLEASQVSLGHASADVTQVYAERNLALAAKVATEMG